MEDTISVLFDKKTVQNRICQLANEINQEYEGKEILLVSILKGSVFFATELAMNIKVPVKMDFMQTSSYGDCTESTGTVEIKKDVDEDIEGKDVIIVEDIIDSGYTMAELLPILQKRNPKSLRLCALLDKPERREVEVPVDYIGFRIPDKFIVGYGLDYAQKYRNLPYIGIVE